MRAVIFATGQSADALPWDDRYPAPLLPLLDRPFIQYVTEVCVSQGIRVFDWVLCHMAAEVEEVLGTGARWGAEFRFHLASDPQRPYERLQALFDEAGKEEAFLLGHADRMPDFRLIDLEQEVSRGKPVLYGVREIERSRGEKIWRWSGWGVVTGALCQSFPLQQLDEARLRKYLSSAVETSAWVDVPQVLSVQNPASVLAANRLLLAEEIPGLILPGKSVEADIRLGRNVRIHSSAILLSPAYIGDDCEIAAGARVGPQAVIGSGSVVDTGSRVIDSVIFPRTYVGEDLELESVLVDRDRVIAIRPAQQLPFHGSYLVGSLSDEDGPALLKLFLSRLTGAVLLVLAAPVLLLLAAALKIWRKGSVLHAVRAIRLPDHGKDDFLSTFSLWSFCHPGEMDRGAAAHAAGWGDFFLRVLPGLFHVFRGDLRLVGLPPRTPEELQRLGPDWRALYLRSRAGLIWEGLLCPNPLSEEEAYAVEAVQAVSAGWRQSFTFAFRYVLNLFTGARRQGSAVGAPPTLDHPYSVQPAEGVSAALEIGWPGNEKIQPAGKSYVSPDALDFFHPEVDSTACLSRPAGG